MASTLEKQPIVPRDGAPTAIRHWGAPFLAHPSRLALSDRGLLIVLLLAVVAAGWPSLGGLLALADGDTPVSFVSLVPFMGAAFLLRRFDGVRLRARRHDGFIDTIVLIPLCVLAVVVLLLLPVMMSWDYWLDRLDVPGLVLLLTCLVVAAWGVSGLVEAGPALLYLLLAWPLPYLLLYNRIIPALTDVTAMATRTVGPLLPFFGIQPDPQDAHALLVTYQGHLNSVVVAQSCAGMNGALGLAVIGLPIALLGRGSWEARGMWLTLGIALSWLVNVVRIVAIVAAVGLWGPGMTDALIHPVLGMILFALSFALLLALAPLCHLDIGASWRAAWGVGTPAVARHILGRRVPLMLSAIVCAGALFDNNMTQFRGVSESTLPRIGLAHANTLFMAPRGWRQVDAQPIDGWAPLFGPSTVAAALTIAAPRQSPVYVQAILTRDPSTFNIYNVEDCYAFHGYMLRAVHRVALGHGVTATRIDFQDGADPAVALYWIQPVQTPQGLYHERVVLITDAQATRLQDAGSASASVDVTPVQRLADALQEVLSPWTGGSSGQVYQAADTQLQRLGQSVIAQELGSAS